MPDNTDTPIKSAIRNEQSILRTELQELKKCQLQYFLLSLGAAGAVLGFNIKMQDDFDNNLFFLAPLLVILPCWRTFFDKATTIIRLTGYVRVFIEDQIIKDDPFYVGYENALSEFRQQEENDIKNMNNPLNNDNMINTPPETTSKKDRPKNRYQYWMINWYTFLILSIVCCILPLFSINNFDYFHNWYIIPFYFLFVIAVIRTACKTSVILKDLKYGDSSYEKVRNYWKEKVFDNLRTANVEQN